MQAAVRRARQGITGTLTRLPALQFSETVPDVPFCIELVYITGTANTGQGASRSTRSVTLPRKASNRPW